MLQFAQYINFKYIEVIPLLFCLFTLVVFIQHIFNAFGNNSNTEYNDNTDNVTKQLKGYTSKFRKFSALLANKYIPIAFIVFFVAWSIISFIPASLNSAFPADSEQSITIKNPQSNSQKIALLGRLSYSNDWKPITPFSPLIQHSPIIKLDPNEEIALKIRTGVNDIDYLIFANLSNSSYSGNIQGIALQMPRNHLIVYTNVMSNLEKKPSLFLLSIFLNIILYFTAIIGCVWLFISVSRSIEEKSIVKIILLGLGIIIPATGCGWTIWWNVESLLLLF